MQLLQVIPLTQSIDTEVLTYFSAKKAPLGSLVSVPLRKKTILAICVVAEDVVNMKTQLRGAEYQIRNVTEIHENQLFSPAFLKMAQSMRGYYATTTGRIISRMSSRHVLKNLEDLKQQFPEQKKSGSFHLKILQKKPEERISYYKTLIREKMLRRESLHIICPTVASCEFWHRALLKNNQNISFLFHGGMTKKKFFEARSELEKISGTSVVISTPGFLDTPQENKTTIAIEEESSNHYYSITSPYIDYRKGITYYCKHAKIECIYAESITRPEIWHLGEQGLAELVTPYTKRVFAKNDITIIPQHTEITGKLSDQERINELTRDTSFSALSKVTVGQVRSAVSQNHCIYIYVHKKSLAPNVVCNDCGNLARSAESGHPYSLYITTNAKTRIKKRMFIAHATGESIEAFDTCQFCVGYNLKNMGIGTESVFQEIHDNFPDVETHIVDASHTKTKKSLKEIKQKIAEKSGAIIIIGTQKALPLFDSIDTSVIASLDSFFARMSYTIETQVMHLVSTLVSLSKNPVLIQSRNILSESLPVLDHGLYHEYISRTLAERKEYNYPPSSTLISIKRNIKRETLKREYANSQRLLKNYDPHIIMKPGKTKAYLELLVIINVERKLWNGNHQDSELWNILRGMHRSVEVRVNPLNLS